MDSARIDILEGLTRAKQSGRPHALATIVATRGSTPRKTGTQMLVDPEQGLTGTVGGGCGEAEVLEAAERVICGGAAEMVRVDLTEDLLSWSPAVCGGIMEVFVERVGGASASTRTSAAPSEPPPARGPDVEDGS